MFEIIENEINQIRKIYPRSNLRENMKYSLLIILLMAILITAGCVSENKNTVVTPPQTTPVFAVTVTTTVPTTVLTTVQTIDQKDPFIGTWIFIDGNGRQYQHKVFENGQIDWGVDEYGTPQKGTWIKKAMNIYLVTSSFYVFTRGYEYDPITDTIFNNNFHHYKVREYREGKVPNSVLNTRLFQGTNDEVRYFSLSRGGGYIVNGNYYGQHNFIVKITNKNGETIQSVFSKTGELHSGEKIIHLDAGEYYLDVKASESWVIYITPS